MEKPEVGKQQVAPPKYKGVRMRKGGKWVAEVRYPNSRKRQWLGSFPTAEMAAMAYDAAACSLRGPGEALNFPDRTPNIPSGDKLSRYEVRQAAARHAQEWSIGRPEEAEASGRQAQEEGGVEVVVNPGESSSGLGASGEPMEEETLLPEFSSPTMADGGAFWGGHGHHGDDDDDYSYIFSLWNF